MKRPIKLELFIEREENQEHHVPRKTTSCGEFLSNEIDSEVAYQAACEVAANLNEDNEELIHKVVIVPRWQQLMNS